MILDNSCPECHQGAILSYVFILNKQCENCGYVFNQEVGAMTGPLYINLTLMGLSTFPFMLLVFFTDASIFSVALMVLISQLFISPFTLRFSKLVWIHAGYRKKP